jgi:membrane associated rhomboid family serine protease
VIPIHDDNPTERAPLVTVALIAACTLAFLWQLSFDAQGQQAAIYALGAIPAVLFGHAELAPDLAWVPVSATPVTSMFLHGGWMHLIGNMLYLWVFGNNVEDAMGHLRYAVFYLVCGLAAVLAQALPDVSSEIPMIGASGAVSGVLGAYFLLHPRARVLVLVPIGFVLQTLRLPALWVLGFWFVIQLVSTLFAAGEDGGGVAFRAHLGGFLAGMALIPLFKRAGVRLEHPFRRR